MTGLTNTAFMTTTLTVFAAFSWGVVGHFRSSGTPPGMKLISFVSLLSVGVVMFRAWSVALPVLWGGIGMALQLVALLLFLLAVRATRRQRLTLAFDDDAPAFLIDTGPYRYIRHPFYTSYMLFWLGCLCALRDLPSLLIVVVTLSLYSLAATREEAKFQSSALRDAYHDYQRGTGFLWPRFKGRS